MLNSNRPSNPTTLGRILAGEKPAPANKPAGPAKPSGTPSLELPPGQIIIFICFGLLIMLVCLSLGVIIGKHSVEKSPQVVTSASPTGNDTNALPPSSRKDASREPAAEDPLTKSPRTVTMPSSQNKVNAFPSNGLPIPPSDLAKITPPKPRSSEYPAPGKPVSSPVPGAALPPSKTPTVPPATSAAPSAPSHDAASQVATTPAPIATPPATPPVKPISPVPAVETASPKTPVTTATPPEGLTKNEKKTEPSVMPLPEKTPDPVAKEKDPKKDASPDDSTASKETPPAKGAYCIQVASFSGENRKAVAEEYKKRLESNSELRSELVTSEDGRYVKVYVGGYPNKETAVRECEKLKKRGGFTGAFVKAR